MAHSNKVVAITGGAGGIGLATAQRLLARGNRVVILDLEGPTVDRTVAELAQTASADQVIGFACDTHGRGVGCHRDEVGKGALRLPRRHGDDGWDPSDRSLRSRPRPRRLVCYPVGQLSLARSLPPERVRG